MNAVTMPIDVALEKAIKLLREEYGPVSLADFQQALDSYREQQMKDERDRQAIRGLRDKMRGLAADMNAAVAASTRRRP